MSDQDYINELYELEEQSTPLADSRRKKKNTKKETKPENSDKIES